MYVYSEDKFKNSLKITSTECSFKVYTIWHMAKARASRYYCIVVYVSPMHQSPID